VLIVCAVVARSNAADNVLSVMPNRGPVGGGTRVVVGGVFDSAPSDWLSFVPDATRAYNAACRFAYDAEGEAAYVPGTSVSLSEISCETPSYTSRLGSGSGRARVSVAFVGYPYDPPEAEYFDGTTWIEGNVSASQFEYYVAPSAREVSVTNSVITGSVSFTGEAPSGRAAVLALDGGVFKEGVSVGAALKCRLGGTYVVDATYVNATRVTCPMCVEMSGGGCGAYGQRLSWLPNPTPTSIEVELSMNSGEDYHPGPLVLIHGAPSGVRVTHSRSSPSLTAYESTKDAGAETMTLDPMTVKLIDNRGTIIADDMGVGGTRGFNITATLDTTLSANTPGVTMTTNPSSIVTTEGAATFQLVFSKPLRMGDYVVHVKGSDCTGTTCVDLVTDATFRFSVVPGAPAALVAVPGEVAERVIHSDDETALGSIDVYVVDAAGNRLYNFDESAHVISVASVDSSNASRTVGSLLQGNTTVSTSRGIATFKGLKIVNPAPTGSRTPGETTFVNNLTYPSPSRGINGVDEVYRFLFSSTFGSAVSAFIVANGQARYVEIDNHTMRTMVTSTSTVSIPNAITLRLYDAGNNPIDCEPNTRLEVRSSSEAYWLSPTSATYAVCATGVGVWSFAANSITLSTKAAGYYVVEIGLEGSEYVRPARQLIELVAGNIGYRWKHYLANGSDVRYSGSSTPLGDLNISVADIGGSLVGAADRFNSSTLAYTVHRTFTCSSATLNISGSLSGDTAGTGNAVLTGLVLQSPTLGVHSFSCSSTGNTLKDSGGNIISTNAVALVALSFNITVTSGTPYTFAFTETPVSLMSSSFGVMSMSTFRLYTGEYYVPLDDFKFQMYDTYLNEVNYVLGGDLAQVVASFTSGVAGDDVGTQSVYMTYNATVANRSAHLVSDPFASSTGLRAAFDRTTNAAMLTGLALRRAAVGSHTLTFSVPAVPALPNVTLAISVALGRAHHLAVRAPCDDYLETFRTTGNGACNSSTTLSRSPATPCTCTQYTSAALVILNPIVIVVMDGGDNPMGNEFNPTCLPGETPPCVGEVEAVFDFEATNPCVVSNSSCASIQPIVHKKTIVNGTVTFDDIAFQLPKSTRQGGTAIIKFRSRGLVDVELSFDIWPGAAHALEVTVPDTFAGGVNDVGLASLTYSLIGRMSQHFSVHVVDEAGNKLLGEDTVNRVVNASLINETASLQGDLSKNTIAGTAIFGSLYFLSPPQGLHVIRFSTSGLQSYNLTVKVVEGPPAKLKHVSTRETLTTYQSASVITFEKFTVHVQDAGGMLLENNVISKRITATLRSTFNSTRTFTTSSYAFAAVDAPLGKAIVVFRGMTSSALETGTYNLTFAGDDLISDTIQITITLGVPSQLYASPLPRYSAKRTISLSSFIVSVVDDGQNQIGTADLFARTISVGIEYADATRADVFSSAPRVSNYTTSSGQAIISTILSPLLLFDPVAGLYKVTLSSSTPNYLKPYTLDLEITLGEVSSLDACGCPSCIRSPATSTYPNGLCADTKSYKSVSSLDLDNIFVVTRDAGGLLLGSTLNVVEPRRAISVMLASIVLVNGDIVTPTLINSPLIADDSDVLCVDAAAACQNNQRMTSVGALYVKNGVAAWCAPGTPEGRANNFCRPATYGAILNFTNAETQYAQSLGSSSVPDVAGSTGDGLDYFGVRTNPSFVGDSVGLRLSHPRAGRYILKFDSVCPQEACQQNVTANSELKRDWLEITVVPGDPHRLELGSQRIPAHFDSNASFPTFEIAAYDVSGNLLTNWNGSVTVTVTPTPHAVLGGSQPLIEGKAKFEDFRIISRRGVRYNLTFALEEAILEVADGVSLFPCSRVKPNSHSKDDGTCECFPGYTEDAEVSGYVNSSATSSFPTLYYQVDPLRIESFVSSLRPYGVCVPCAVGYYKNVSGAQACYACPPNMDTLTGNDGKPRDLHVTAGGESLPGYVANLEKDSCQCTLTGPPVNGSKTFTSFYRLDPYETYSCSPCPPGAVCDSRNITKLSLLSGNWRLNASTLEVLPCKSPNSCKGGVGEGDDLCNDGYSGPLCGTCDASSGYANLEDSRSLESSLKCTKCWPKWLNGFAIFGLSILQTAVMALIIRAAQSEVPTQIIYTKSVLSHFHMLSTLGTINLGWPAAAGVLFPLSRLSSTTSIKSFSVDCVSKWSHLQYTRYSFIVVVVFLSLCVPTYLFVRLKDFYELRKDWYEKKRSLENAYIAARREGENVDRLKWQLDRMKKAPDLNDGYPDAYNMQMHTKVDRDGYVVQEWTDEELAALKPTPTDVAAGFFYAIMFSMCWFPILTNVLKMIRTTKIQNVGTFLVVDYNVHTDDPGYTETLITYLLFGAVLTSVFPYTVFYYMKSHKMQLEWSKTKARYGYLYIGYTEEMWYWEFMVMIRKALLAGTAILLPDKPTLAAYISIAVIQGFLSVVLLVDIYERPHHRRAEITSLTTILVSYNAGALMVNVKHVALSAIASIIIYALNFYFVLTILRSVREDIEEEVVAAKIAAEKRALQEEHELRRNAVQHALVSTHEASKALHPRMAEELIAAFDNDTLIKELSKPGANDLKLRHLQLNVHLESLRNKWRESKSTVVNSPAALDRELEALALKRRHRSQEHGRWRHRVDDMDTSSSDVEHRSGSDDSAYVAQETQRANVEARVTQYNEIMAQQLRIARDAETNKRLGFNLTGKSTVDQPEPLYPAGYIPPQPRLPARDTVSWNPPAADILLSAPMRPAKKPSQKHPKPPVPSDPFTYDYFEMSHVRDALPPEAQIAKLQREVARQVAGGSKSAKSKEASWLNAGPRKSWKEKMTDTRWRVQKRIEARENAAMEKAFADAVAKDEGVVDADDADTPTPPIYDRDKREEEREEEREDEDYETELSESNRSPSERDDSRSQSEYDDYEEEEYSDDGGSASQYSDEQYSDED